MFYEEYRTSPPLNQYVQLIWLMRNELPGPLPPPERIVADGIVELVFHFGTPFTTRFRDGPPLPEPTSYVITQLNHPIRIQPAGPVGVVAVRFFPWGAYHFLDVPIRHLADQQVPARDIWGTSVSALEEQLAGATGPRARVRLVEAFLLQQLSAFGRTDPTPDRIIRAIHGDLGRRPVAQVAGDAGLSPRSLERKMLASVGISPKHLSRLARFLHSCSWMRAHPRVRLTEAAYRCGYYDQAHFIGEFRQFAGITPGQFVQDLEVAHLRVN